MSTSGPAGFHSQGLGRPCPEFGIEAQHVFDNALCTPVEITLSTRADSLWVRIRGELDMTNRADALWAISSVDLSKSEALHLDLEQLRFCDVIGARPLLRLERQARLAGLQTRIHGARPTIRKMMCFLAPDVGAAFEVS